MIWLIFLTVILITIAAIMAAQFFNIIFRGFAPFISSKPAVIKRILNEIDFNDNNHNVYELGCGKAGFLRVLEKKKPAWEYIGVENSFLPWLIAKIQISFNHSKIKIIKENLFKINLVDADLIYCYLNVEMMKKLGEKFKRECKSGAKIISYAFIIPNLKPEKVVELENGGKIYFYVIRV
ncbi:MAG: hypothetical protein U9R14_03610 [Patescibacteria group bacterium]|nr:hypothetical protein [Patescibacteria group bacterium]